MKTIHFAMALAASASLCSAGAQSKNPTKAELARMQQPVVSQPAPSPLGGGSDDCLNAATQDAISGLGNFAVDMTLATTGATPPVACTGFMTKDVWFEWTSTVTGSVIVATCTHTTSDTVIGVWTGAGCPVGTTTACNDDFCGFQSQVTFAAISGSVYMIQVGMYNNAIGVLTSMDISTPPPPPTNDDCTTPIALAAGSLVVPFNSSTATTGAQGQAEALCLEYAQIAVAKDLWYTWTPTAGGPVTVTTCGLMTGPTANADTKIAVYDGAGCPAATALACNDDQGLQNGVGATTCTAGIFNSTLTFTAVCGQTYTLQIGQFPVTSANNNVGAFQITESVGTCSTPSTSFCSGDAAGTTCVACGNNGAVGRGCANSSFVGGAQLASSGNASVGADTLVLTCSSMTGPGLFFQANGLAGSPIGFGDGMLCAAAGILRMGVVFPVAGTASYPGGLTPNPITIAGGPIAAGNTKHYQCWYRDAVVFCTASTFNTSNGVSLTWVP